MSNVPTVPPPGSKTPVLSPEAWRALTLGSVVFLVVLGVDLTLELTGHGGSALASALTKGIVALVGVGTAFATARAPGPKQASIERKLADSLRPPPPQV